MLLDLQKPSIYAQQLHLFLLVMSKLHSCTTQKHQVLITTDGHVNFLRQLVSNGAKPQRCISWL